MTGGCEAERAGERALVAAARAGSAAAFALLVERHHLAILRYLARQTGDRELAADLAQETFLDAYRSLGRLGEEVSFAAWLHRIARHNLLPAWRRRRLRRFVSLDRLWGGEPAAAADEAACDERDLIQRALDGLGPALREALVLHDLQGFTGREVGAILGISPAAARQRVARARARFRERYRALEGGDDAAGV